MRVLLVLLILYLTGCSYVPREVYEIVTKDGQTIKLYCPKIDRGRNSLTYIVDGGCILIKD